MPRLSDYYLQGQEVAGVTQVQPLPTRPAQPVQQHVVSRHPPSAAAVQAADAVHAEVARLAQQHSNRVRQHGHRVYRQADGSLAPKPPNRQPYTVANRQKWHGLVQHCRQAPGVNQLLERNGCSAHYGIKVTHLQHVAALEAAGLVAEFDTTGSWSDHKPGAQDPLADDLHSLRHDSWKAITGAVLQRAVDVHGPAVLVRNSWCQENYC